MVYPRVIERHPEIDEADVICACVNAFALMQREPFMSGAYIGSGADRKGRLLEFAGKETEDGSLLVYHAMKLTRKMQLELGL